MITDTMSARKAIEAMRSGVPNMNTVAALEPLQPEVTGSFRRMLDDAVFSWEQPGHIPGLLIEGDFGSGKSHMIEYLQHLALANNFVCSTIILNKETPFFDLNKIYRACVESAKVPGNEPGSALDITALNYDFNSAPGYRDFFMWVQQSNNIDPRLPATICLFEHNRSEEVMEKVLSEWRGYPMKVSEMRAALKETGYGRDYSIGRPQSDSALQLFEFTTRFFHSAGYAGWILLFDEAEIISRYSLRQRARSYAHLARFFGAIKRTDPIPGLASVFTITKDYAGQVLYRKKKDKISIPEKLRGSRDDAYVGPAETGMKVIETRGKELLPPSRDDISIIYDRVRTLYADAYSWEPPDVVNAREYLSSTPMRQYIRAWINSWDMLRLYGYSTDNVFTNVSIDYEEEVALQEEDAQSY